jgi:ankyrin repeat protein/actin-like ATPase involved in cell morphogenesis
MARTFCSVKRKLKDNIPQALPDGTVVSPVELAADILRHIKRSAEQHCFNQTVTKVVLTHPVLFLQKEKDRLLEAAELAGFGEIILVEEPVAAVLGYAASGAKAGSGILVYDLGGGTLDLAFVHREDEQEYHIPVEPSGGVFGGDDFDQAVYDHFEGRLRSECGVGFSSDSGMVNLAVLMEARKCKEKLSSSPRARLSYLLAEQNRNVSYELTQADLENLIRDYVQRTVGLTRTMLQRVRDAGRALDTVVLVGGSTRIPLIQRELKACLPVEPLKTMHADVAVAMGAAVVAHESKAAPDRYPSKKTPIPVMGFADAITAGDVTEVRRHIAHGADLQKLPSPDYDYLVNSPLALATAHGRDGIVETLLQSGAAAGGLPEDSLPPVHWAARNGSARAVALLQAAGAKLDWTDLHFATASGRLSEVSMLLGNDAAIDARDDCGWTPLHLAARNGHTSTVKALLEAGANIELKDRRQQTPLFRAVVNGHSEVVKALLGAGADLEVRDEWGWTPVYLVAHDGHIAMLRVLLEAGASLESPFLRPTPVKKTEGSIETNRKKPIPKLQTLERITWLDRATTVTRLRSESGGVSISVESGNPHYGICSDTVLNISTNVESDARTEEILFGMGLPLPQAGETILVKKGFGGCIVTRETFEDRDTLQRTVRVRLFSGFCQVAEFPLSVAAQNGHGEVVDFLLKAGADIEVKHQGVFGTRSCRACTPLRGAAENGHASVVALLLDAGAVIGVEDGLLRTVARNGHAAVVSVLLAAGADIEATDLHGYTPLHWAAQQGHEAVAKVLIEAGAVIEARDKNAYTPLHWAAQQGHEAVAKLLIEAGAVIEAREKNGYTPLHWAAQQGHEAVAKVLLEVGADKEAKDLGGMTPLARAKPEHREGLAALFAKTGRRGRQQS